MSILRNKLFYLATKMSNIFVEQTGENMKHELKRTIRYVEIVLEYFRLYDSKNNDILLQYMKVCSD